MGLNNDNKKTYGMIQEWVSANRFFLDSVNDDLRGWLNCRDNFNDILK